MLIPQLCCHRNVTAFFQLTAFQIKSEIQSQLLYFLRFKILSGQLVPFMITNMRPIGLLRCIWGASGQRTGGKVDLVAHSLDIVLAVTGDAGAIVFYSVDFVMLILTFQFRSHSMTCYLYFKRHHLS